MPLTRVYNLHRVGQRQLADVYIGRAGKGESGRFGNAYTLKEHGDDALLMYERDLFRQLRDDRPFQEEALSHQGRRLLCFCLAQEWRTDHICEPTCHGQILALYIDALCRAGQPVTEAELFDLCAGPRPPVAFAELASEFIDGDLALPEGQTVRVVNASHRTGEMGFTPKLSAIAGSAGRVMPGFGCLVNPRILREV